MTKELYSTEIWHTCQLLHKKIKDIVADRLKFDDTILKRDLLQCSFFIIENLLEAYDNPDKVKIPFLSNALSFTEGLEKSLTTANVLFYIPKNKYLKLMRITNEIKAIIQERIKANTN